MKPDTIVLHHSLTGDGATVSWSAIRNYHTSYKHGGMAIDARQAEKLISQGVVVEKPWRDIGYHYGIERVGGRYEVLCGRMPDEQGAHCRENGMNRRSLGICLVGNFDLAAPPPEQWDLSLRLVRALMAILGIGAGSVHGHREFATYKSCPGAAFDLDRFRAELAAAQQCR